MKHNKASVLSGNKLTGIDASLVKQMGDLKVGGVHNGLVTENADAARAAALAQRPDICQRTLANGKVCGANLPNKVFGGYLSCKECSARAEATNSTPRTIMVKGKGQWPGTTKEGTPCKKCAMNDPGIFCHQHGLKK